MVGYPLADQIVYWIKFGWWVFVAVSALWATITLIRNTSRGGLGLMKLVTKFNRFIDRIDVVVDDFFPEILGALEKRGLVTSGAGAKWASLQARVLKSQSPIQITDMGKKLVAAIGLAHDYTANAPSIKERVLAALPQHAAEYDLEKTALQVGREMFDEGAPISRNAKSYLFNHPEMAATEMQALIGIYIRDELRKDIDVVKRIELKNPAAA
mgnify:FL=1